jgi:hypothetical protein
MKRTTVVLSDELHEQLRRDAFKARVSMAEIIRLKLQMADARPRRKKGKYPILKVAGICRGPILSRNIDESLYGGR